MEAEATLKTDRLIRNDVSGLSWGTVMDALVIAVWLALLGQSDHGGSAR
jgi:hypothetical protein